MLGYLGEPSTFHRIKSVKIVAVGYIQLVSRSNSFLYYYVVVVAWINIPNHIPDAMTGKSQYDISHMVVRMKPEVGVM